MVFDPGCARALVPGLALWLLACGNDGGDPGRGDSTTSEGGASAQPTSFTETMTSTASTTLETDAGSGLPTTTDGESSGSESAICPDSHRCVPEAPVDWQGPIAASESLLASAVTPQCPDAYPQQVAEVFSGISADPAECSCSCGEAMDAACSTISALRYYTNADATCSAVAPTSVLLTSTACTNLNTTFAGNGHWVMDPIASVGGSCQPTSNTVVGDAAFENRLVACGEPELLPGCAMGNVCAPRAPDDFDPGMCVVREGEHDCPSTYPDRHLFYADINDLRSCSPCSCSDPVGLCDSAIVRLYESGCVLPISAILTPNGGCQDQASTPVSYGRLTAGEPTAFCEPSESGPIGEAAGQDPLTVCCLD